jgi:hypothetical protein
MNSNFFSFRIFANCLFIVLLTGVYLSTARAQSIAVGGGILSWTVSEQTNRNAYCVYTVSNFSNFNFRSNGITYPLSGGEQSYIQNNNGSGGACPPNGPQPSNGTVLTGNGDCSFSFIPNGLDSGNASGSCTPVISYQDYIYPKYIVVGVTYAPPGDGSGAVSTAQYTGTTAVGTTTTKGISFSNDVGFSVKVTGRIGAVGLTASESTDYTQASNSSSSITFSKSTAVAYSTNGYPTTFPITSGAAPLINPTAIPAGSTINPHDWDVIRVWLNAVQVLTAFPATSTTPVTFEWDGYMYDPADMAGPDVYPVQVGCLNGDFSVAYCTSQQGVLNRDWVTKKTSLQMSPTTGATMTASGCPETAESPSICPNTQDAYNILAADPFAYNPAGTTYTLLNSSPLPSTTSDGRFTQFGYPPNPVDYEPGQSLGFTVTQMDTQSVSNGGSTVVKEKFSVAETVKVDWLNLFKSSTTFTESDTMTWTNTWLDSLTSSQTVQDAFTVKGSNPPNYVPGEFLVYQDNQYGTFMFYPSN